MVNVKLIDHSVSDINRLVYSYYVENPNNIPEETLLEMSTGTYKDNLLDVAITDEEKELEIKTEYETMTLTLKDDKVPRDGKMWSVLLFLKDKTPLSYKLYDISSGDINTTKVKQITINYRVDYDYLDVSSIKIRTDIIKHLENTIKVIDDTSGEKRIHSYIPTYKEESTVPIQNIYNDTTNFNIVKLDNNSECYLISHSEQDYIYCSTLNKSLDMTKLTKQWMSGSNCYGMFVGGYYQGTDSKGKPIYEYRIYPTNNVRWWYTHETPPDGTIGLVLVEGIILVAYTNHEIYVSPIKEDDRKFDGWYLAYKNDKHKIYIPSFFDICPVMMLDDGSLITMPTMQDDIDYEAKKYLRPDTYNPDNFYDNKYNIYKIESKEDLAIFMSYLSPTTDSSRFYDNLVAMRETYKTLKLLPEYRDAPPNYEFYDCGVVVDYSVFIQYSAATGYRKYAIVDTRKNQFGNQTNVIMNLSKIAYDENTGIGTITSLLDNHPFKITGKYKIGRYGYVING